MTLEAIIFDVDGTLADTERDGHRLAFNAAFAEAGLDWEWDEREYGELLTVAGGIERMTHYARTRREWTGDDGHIRQRLAQIHAAKTALYLAHVAAGRVRLRPGVERLISEARAAGVSLAIATTTTRDNVLGLLETSLGRKSPSWFVAIGTAAEVERKKPDPAVYRWVLERLRVEPDRVVAIEDNRNGLLAATGAGLRCVVTPTPYSAGEDFTTALAVAETLDHHPGRPGAVVRLNDLRDWMAQAPR